MSWFWLILIVTNLFAVSDLIDKFLCEKKFKNTYAFALTNTLLGSIFILALCFLVDYSGASGWPLLIALATGPIYFFMWVFLWKALATQEASRAIAVFNTMPIFNALLAVVFLKEKIASSSWLAIFLIAVGAALCTWERKSKSHFHISYQWVVLAAFLAAIGNVASKQASFYIDSLTLYPLSFFGSFPLYLAVFLKKEIRSEIKTNLKNKKIVATLFVRNLITFIAVCLFYLAIAKGPISLVMAINGTGPLFVFIYATLASLFLPKYIKEDLDSSSLLQKSLAIILIVSGVILIN